MGRLSLRQGRTLCESRDLAAASLATRRGCVVEIECGSERRLMGNIAKAVSLRFLIGGYKQFEVTRHAPHKLNVSANSTQESLTKVRAPQMKLAGAVLISPVVVLIKGSVSGWNTSSSTCPLSPMRVASTGACMLVLEHHAMRHPRQ